MQMAAAVRAAAGMVIESVAAVVSTETAVVVVLVGKTEHRDLRAAAAASVGMD